MAIQNIEVVEDHRIGDRVNIRVIGSDYNRYVPCADWDTDPEAIAATIAEYLASMPIPQVFVPSANAKHVFLRGVDVEAKLANMATVNDDIAAAAIAKAAEEAESLKVKMVEDNG